MTNRLRVLQVEDSESDAALVVRVLEKAGYHVDSERVEDAGGMVAALARGAWDVIIADYRLPHFDAPAALRTLRETGSDIPFLVVSANIGEALAVEMMRSGAHDYVMKDKLARLAPAVEREVREAQARRQQRQAEERLALAISATQLGTFDFDPRTGNLVWSGNAKQQCGLAPDAEVSYEIFLRAVHPDDRERVNNSVQIALRPGGNGRFAAEYRTIGIDDGVERSLSASGQVFFDPQGRAVRLVGVTLDITERKRLEDQFRQAQKLESIGRLAGGVAHDFNNLLTVISGYGQMVLDGLGIHHPLREPMQEVAKAATRASDLTRQLLTFSRRQAGEPRNIDLNDLVGDIEKMLRRLIGEDIDLVLVLRPEAGLLRADGGQIEQVIMNLVVNARDAMPNGGKLVTETSRFNVDERFAQTHLSIRTGAHVMLAVSDTGTGMSDEVKAHVFEPFFTTKDPGKGTGLGLSTVYGIVKQNDGAIWIYSEPGRGSVFKMLFPAVDGTPEAVREAPGEVVRSGQGTILLAEDEPDVRDLVHQILARRGYTVLQASNGREALELARRHPGKLDLLLADVVMPEMGGAELAETFAADYPGVPVLLMSGYTDRLFVQGESPASYIQKPFTSAILLTRVQGLLQRHPSA